RAGGHGNARTAVHAAVRHRPLHRRADEHRSELDARAAAVRADAAVASIDLITVVLVISYPVDVIEGAIITAQRIVIVVPEALQAHFFGRHAIAMGEGVPPGLIAAVAQAAAPRLGLFRGHE